MKNIILGMIGGAVAIYLVVFCLSVYSISARKNEMENCISQVLEQNMIHFYGNTDNDVEVKQADSKIVVDVYTCDMKNGIIAATIQEEFYLPIGTRKNIACTKTVIAEEEIVETEM